MVALIADVAIKRRWIELGDADPPTNLEDAQNWLLRLSVAVPFREDCQRSVRWRFPHVL